MYKPLTDVWPVQHMLVYCQRMLLAVASEGFAVAVQVHELSGSFGHSDRDKQEESEHWVVNRSCTVDLLLGFPVGTD